MIRMEEIKMLAAQTVLFAMEEIRDNLQRTSKKEDVRVNSEAMKTLAEALKEIVRQEMISY